MIYGLNFIIVTILLYNVLMENLAVILDLSKDEIDKER